MDRYLAVQRVGDGLIAVALPVGVLFIGYDNNEAGLWVAAVCIVAGGVLSYFGQVRKERELEPPFDMDPDWIGSVTAPNVRTNETSRR